MDVLWIVLGVIFLLAGFVGCFLPVLPGPPLAYVSLLFLQLKEEAPFSTKFLVLWALGVMAITLLDYFLAPLAARRFGGTRKGVIGSSVGIVAGLFLFPPWGIVFLPFVGAWIGEMLAGKDQRSAVRPAFGTFVGFLSGTLLKVTVTVVIGYYFFSSL